MAPSVLQIAARFAPAVDRDLVRRGRNVRDAAQDNLRGRGRAPRRVDTGTLLRSIGVTPPTGPLLIRSVRIGTNDRKSWWVHDGTGLYGPRRARIYPTRAQVLAFYSRRAGRVVFARSVAGMRPNPFLKNALRAARD